MPPLGLQIVEPTTARPRFAGTSVAGSRVLVRLYGAGLDLSPANLTLSVAGMLLTPAQIPTPATQVGAENVGRHRAGSEGERMLRPHRDADRTRRRQRRADSKLRWADDESRDFDRVLAIDQTNSMNYDSSTNLHSTAKMDAARAAAKFFVDLCNPNDKIGVISFQRRDQNHDGTIVDPDELAEPNLASPDRRARE